MGNTTTVKVYNGEKYAGDWPPEKLSDAIAWLQAKLETVPPEYREFATFEIDGVDDYGSPSAEITIEYRRPMTSDEEAATRAEEDKRTLALLRQAEHQAQILRNRLKGRAA